MQHRTQLELEARREAAKTMEALCPNLKELVSALLVNVDAEIAPARNYHGLVRQLKSIISIIWNRWHRGEPVYDGEGTQFTDEDASALIAELRHIVNCYEEYML